MQKQVSFPSVTRKRVTEESSGERPRAVGLMPPQTRLKLDPRFREDDAGSCVVFVRKIL